MEKEQVKALLARYADGKCTAEEATQVEAWYRRIAKQQGDSLVDADYAHLYAQAHERLMQSISDSQLPNVPKKNWHWPFYAAAAVLLATLSIVYFFLPEPADPVQILTTSPILPGGNYATLTVAGGQSLRLDSNQSGISVDGERIVYTDNQPIEKAILRMDDLNDASVPLELTTPKGGTYQVTLADGTIVWLNAASTLKYPSRFTDKERVVEILGEGYFAVAKDSKKPFIVKAAGQVVEVLGTEFNISAYDDEPAVKTTLVNGSVRVKPMSLSRGNTQLIPSEQSILTTTGTLTVAKVDTYAETAWKNGLMSLTNVQFDVLMRQLSRWYNIDIKYKGNLSHIRFEGEVTRDVTLEDLLDFFKDSGLLFEITNNRTLIVKEKK